MKQLKRLTMMLALLLTAAQGARADDDMKSTPLTMEVTEAGTVQVTISNLGNFGGMKYQVEGEDKTLITKAEGVVTVTIPETGTLAAGTKVMFYGNGTDTRNYGSSNKVTVQITGGSAKVNVYGNIMSLLNEENFASVTTLPAGEEYVFAGLFENNTKLTDASGLLLPAKTLTKDCYNRMFKGCSRLKAAPALPATTLADGCYSQMFWECSSLTAAPALPAKTLAKSCYSTMFIGCSSLKAAPALPAKTLADGCYASMFSDCSSLEAAPALPAKTLVESCYAYMFDGCTSLTDAPALPAKTLAEYCYASMFYGCSKLASVICLATDISAKNCTLFWLGSAGSSATGEKTFTKPSETEWSYDDSGIPSGWTRVDYIPTYDVTLDDGGVDTQNWTAKFGDATEFGALPLKGVKAGQKVALQYTGEREVKSITAVVHDPLTEPLTMKALTAGTIVVSNPQSGMQYSLNGGAKKIMDENPMNFTLAAGEKVAFYGNGKSITSYGNSSNPTTITGNGSDFKVKMYGNIMSLVDEEGFATATELTGTEAFAYLFYQNTALTDVSELVMPATTLTERCYYNMFSDCTGLTEIPADLLPATTLTVRCYADMFSLCTGLTEIPADLLPATTLTENCYKNMFTGCTGLTEVPADLLPATTLANFCYYGMFSDCTGLNTVPTDLLPATTLAEYCYLGMFANCSALTTAPELYAPTLTEACYIEMFKGCSSLSSITCTASNLDPADSTIDWIEGVASTGTFTKAWDTDWSSRTGFDGIPSGWTVEY
jgi:hypothetical protein